MGQKMRHSPSRRHKHLHNPAGFSKTKNFAAYHRSYHPLSHLHHGQLLKYKEMVQGNDGGDLVISLSNSLKNEKLKIDELVKQNKALKDSLNALSKNNSSSGKNNNEKPANTNDSKSQEFVLPKEN